MRAGLPCISRHHEGTLHSSARCTRTHPIPTWTVADYDVAKEGILGMSLLHAASRFKDYLLLNLSFIPPPLFAVS